MHEADATRAAIAEIAAKMDPIPVGEAIGRHAIAVVLDLSGRSDRDLERETIAAAVSNVEAVLDGLVRGQSPSESQAPDESVAWASTLVHRGVGAASIPRCYCVGQAMMDVALREAAKTQDLPPAVKWDVAAEMSQFLFAYVEKVCGDLIEHYERERDRWVRGADSGRTELVLAMVEGHPFDAATAGATLRYDLERPHVALILWADPDRTEAPRTTALKEAAARLARELGGKELLVVPVGQSVVWAWTTGPQLSDLPVEPLVVDAGIFGAVGGLAVGADGFTRSHREARQARRMSGLLSRPAGSVVPYRAVGLEALLTRDPGAAADFVEAELGPLSADTDASRRLRDTLAVFFEEAMSWGRAAPRLGVHQNTVIYRVRRAEELLGRPLSERRLELETALRLADATDSLRAATTR